MAERKQEAAAAAVNAIRLVVINDHRRKRHTATVKLLSYSDLSTSQSILESELFDSSFTERELLA